MELPSADETAARLKFLARPDAYPDRPAVVEVIETHFAWVFLSRRLVYKLKKPIRAYGFDLTTLAARRANCELEVALNRRLAATVYLGVVPLVRSGSSFRLEGPGDAEEWLVKMRRLPRDRTLDCTARTGTMSDRDLALVIDKLAAFYASTARAPWNGREYCDHLERSIERYAAELEAPDLGVARVQVSALCAAQLSFVRDWAAVLAARQNGGRVVDAHGDLRPEHIFLGEPPQIIDCLEFSDELRRLDTAEEIAFLILECDRLGCDAIAKRLGALYRQRCADDAPPELFAFYRSRRAVVRALLALLHLRDQTGDEERWRRRAQWYLDAASAALAPRPAAPVLQRGATR